jgi:catechol 2,3-dioxygenase-like lactoylglutathione lyase family enzyme
MSGMFTDTEAFSGFAADDLETCERFYGETLGLETSISNGILTLHIAGGRDTIIYAKPDHVPAHFTVLNFPVRDIEAAVDELAARGVEFERYDGMDERCIKRDQGPPIAWFKDPAGNILSVIRL